MTEILDRQIKKAQGRLFARSFLSALIWCVSGALLLGCLWFLAQPYVLAEASPQLRWYVLGGVVGLAVVGALVMGWWNCPSRLDSALLLDRRFGLKERATTSMLLSADARSSPAGQALLEDAAGLVGGLQVASRFPVGVGWRAACVPVCAALLAAIVFFYNPAAGKAGGDKKTSADQVAKVEAEQQKEELDTAMKKLDPPTRTPGDTTQEKTDEFDEKMGAIAHRPRETKEERERRWAELAQVEAEMKKKQAAEKDKEDKLRDQLKKDESERLKKKPKEGPAKDLQDALDKGDTKKAQEEVERLAKKLRDDKDDKLTPEEQKQLQEQLDDMEKELQRLSRQKDEEKVLQDLAKNGEIDKEALDREMDELKKEGETHKDIKDIEDKLKEMADKGEISKEDAEKAINQLEKDKQDLKDLEQAAKDLKDAQDSMNKGDQEQAAQKLEQAGQKMTCKQCQGNQQKLAQQLSRVQQAKGQMAKAAGQGKKGSGNGPNSGGVGSGRRPEEKDDRIGFDRTKIDGSQDTTGTSEITGDGPKPDKAVPKDPKDIAEQIQPRSQEAARAVGQQKKILKDAAEMTKGFFENLGEQKPEKK